MAVDLILPKDYAMFSKRNICLQGQKKKKNPNGIKQARFYPAYCNRGERLSSPVLKQKVGESGSTVVQQVEKS